MAGPSPLTPLCFLFRMTSTSGAETTACTTSTRRRMRTRTMHAAASSSPTSAGSSCASTATSSRRAGSWISLTCWMTLSSGSKESKCPDMRWAWRGPPAWCSGCASFLVFIFSFPSLRYPCHLGCRCWDAFPLAPTIPMWLILADCPCSALSPVLVPLLSQKARAGYENTCGRSCSDLGLLL